MATKSVLVCLLMAATSLVTGACATSGEQAGSEYYADAPPKDEIVCRRVRPVGSHVPVDVCRKVRDAEEDRRRALEAVGPLRTMSGDLPPPPPPPPSSQN